MLEYIILAIVIFVLCYIFFYNDYGDYKPILQAYEKVKEEEMVEEYVPPPQPIYQLNTHKIKYLIFNPDLLTYYGSRELYEKIVLQNEWLNEPFCSTVFKILMILDNDEFVIKDKNSRTIISNLRGKHNKMIQVKSYQVFSTLEIVKSFFLYAFVYIKQYNKNDGQDIVIACLLMIISQSKHFETKQSIDVYNLYIKGYDRKSQIENILQLVQSNAKEFQFIHESLSHTFKMTYQIPYVENPDNSFELTRIPSLPFKVLMHI